MEDKILAQAKKKEILFFNRSRVSAIQSETFAPLVSIIICNRDGLHNLKTLFSSFKTCTFYRNFEIIVVDNASTDDSIRFLEKQKDDFALDIIRNNINETFSKACNQGANIAKGEYLLFLNNDIEVTDYWLDELLKVAETHDNAGAIGAQLIYPEIPTNTVNTGKDYKVQHAGILFHRQWFEGAQYIRPYNKGNGDEPFAEGEKTITIAGVTAACLLMKKTVFNEIGGFDEHYVYGYEDVDLNLKALRKGYTNYYCPTAVLFHYEFGTQQNDVKKEVVLRRKNNLLYFTRRWHEFLKQNILQDKVFCKKIFSEEPLTVAFAVKDETGIAGNDTAVGDLANALREKGYAVKYLQYDGTEGWYDIGNDTDIIISTTPEYDIRKIKTADSNIICYAWVRENAVLWCNSSSFYFYRFVLTESKEDSEIIFLNSKRVAYEFNREVELLVHLATLCCCQYDHKLMILLPVPNQNEAESWGDYHFAIALKKCFGKRGYETELRFLHEWNRPFNGKYVLVLRGLKKYVPEMSHINLMWNISHPDDIEDNEYNMYDVNFISSEILAEQLRKQVRAPVIPLLQCTDTDLFTGERDERVEKSEILFVGNTRGIFRDVVRHLLPTEHQLSVYGKGWDKFIDPKHIKGTVIPNKELNYYYSNCDILLNDHWEDMKQKGFISNRIFDGLAAGAFVLTDKVEGMNADLKACVAIYENEMDLREKVDYYLERPELRKQMAVKGQQLVREKHSFQQRVDRIIRYIEEFK